MEASIVEARGSRGIMEFRLDYLNPEHLRASNVAKWVELAQGPVVHTLRRRANGGEFDGSEADQVRILESLSGAFVDLEIETIEGFLGGSLASLKPACLTQLLFPERFLEFHWPSVQHPGSARR